ncbi:hypothetical protein Poli38472_010791 [Pythium oligandrum]|uniref:KIF-binding protein n=1 Tax=Pythium oligandrum TaxID=41045 RepID=A0A8K1CEU9_PYTOL|nr:hypothetical protein Poli38472_010791 [Pythium oligandrum]|eukprot:TMW61728.1 hypothetical protein Poli38472_010791 [Pythium oligandrum]
MTSKAESMIPEDFTALLRHVEELAATPNPDATPYASHYQSIEILQKWLTTPMDPLEEAIARIKLGTTYLHVEEPHQAQPMLEQAATFFYPKLLEYIKTIDEPSEQDEGKEDEPIATQIQRLLTQLPGIELPEELRSSERAQFAHYPLELLNQAGILWSNRTQPRRALCCFHACVQLASSIDALSCKSEEEAEELRSTSRSIQAHAQFYLAQVYGTLQLADASAQACLATLELQLQGFLALLAQSKAPNSRGETTVNDWVKNAVRLAEYYLETAYLHDAATCLYASEYILGQLCTQPSDEDDEERRLRLGEIHMTWAKIHQLTLQEAVWRQDTPLPPNTAPAPDQDAPIETKSLERLLGPADASDLKSFSSLLMQVTAVGAIKSFDTAREVFKQGMSASDAALQIFSLDGFVTAHVRLRQLQSRLYRRLVAFETDRKRQIAMHLRRLGLLTPLLTAELNPAAYTALIQELLYEAAEVATELHDLKQLHKPNEANNTYAFKAIQWYRDYIALFYPSGPARLVLPSQEMTPEEFKAVLHGYFALGRVCGKVWFPQDQEKTVACWKQAIESFEAVKTLVKLYERLPGNEARASALRTLYGAELVMCDDMIELLPEKINQLVYNGKRV